MTQQAKKFNDLDAQEIIEALNDPAKADALMAAKGWERKDLVARAEEITKELSAGLASVNCV